MEKQLMIYERVAPITLDKHRDITVQTGKDWRFASQLNTIPVLAAEIEPASAELPIVFAGEGENMSIVALTALRAGENLFVSPGGGWQGSYVPAFLRRYPFVFAETGPGGETLTLCIDEACDGVNSDGLGERLFDSAGERTHYLDRMLQFTSDYQTQHRLTRAFCQRLVALDLLESAVANVKLPDGQTLTLTGFQRISRDKLRDLDDATVTQLFRSDMLGLIYFHLGSLAHLSALANRSAPATPAQQPEAADA